MVEEKLEDHPPFEKKEEFATAMKRTKEVTGLTRTIVLRLDRNVHARNTDRHCRMKYYNNHGHVCLTSISGVLLCERNRGAKY